MVYTLRLSQPLYILFYSRCNILCVIGKKQHRYFQNIEYFYNLPHMIP